MKYNPKSTWQNCQHALDFTDVPVVMRVTFGTCLSVVDVMNTFFLNGKYRDFVKGTLC